MNPLRGFIGPTIACQRPRLSEAFERILASILQNRWELQIGVKAERKSRFELPASLPRACRTRVRPCFNWKLRNKFDTLPHYPAELASGTCLRRCTVPLKALPAPRTSSMHDSTDLMCAPTLTVLN